MAVLKTFDQLVRAAILRLNSTQPLLDTKIGTVVRDIIEATLDQVGDYYNNLSTVSDLQSLLNNTGEELDNLLTNYQLIRNEATFSTGTIYLTKSILNASDNITISDGAIVSSTGTEKVDFQIIGTFIMSGSDRDTYRATAIQVKNDLLSVNVTNEYAIAVPIKAVVAGSLGNVGSFAIANGSIDGIDNIINIDPTTGGIDKESDDSFRDRGALVFAGSDSSTSSGLEAIVSASENIQDVLVVGPSSALLLRDGKTVDSDGNITAEGTGGKVDIWISGENLTSYQETHTYTDEGSDSTDEDNNIRLGRTNLVTGIDQPRQPITSITSVIGQFTDGDGNVENNTYIQNVHYELQKDIEQVTPSDYANSTEGYDKFHWLLNFSSIADEEITKGILYNQDELEHRRVSSISSIKEDVVIRNEQVETNGTFTITTNHYPIKNVTRVYNMTTNEEYTIASMGENLISLSDNVNSTQTTISVTSTMGFNNSGTFFIDSETITYTGKTATTFTGLTRGVSGTMATNHIIGATISNGSDFASGVVQIYGIQAPSTTDAVQVTYTWVRSYEKFSEYLLKNTGTYNQSFIDWSLNGILNSSTHYVTLLSQQEMDFIRTESITETVVGDDVEGGTTTTAYIGAGSTNIPVNSTTGFLSSGVIWIEGEAIFYENITSSTFYLCTRGIYGTTAVAHNKGKAVASRQSPWTDTFIKISVSNGRYEQRATQNRRVSRVTGVYNYNVSIYEEKIEDGEAANTELQLNKNEISNSAGTGIGNVSDSSIEAYTYNKTITGEVHTTEDIFCEIFFDSDENLGISNKTGTAQGSYEDSSVVLRNGTVRATTLTADLSKTDGTITVTDTSSFGDIGDISDKITLLIDNEFISAFVSNGTTFTITYRAVEGTRNVTHGSGAIVYDTRNFLCGEYEWGEKYGNGVLNKGGFELLKGSINSVTATTLTDSSKFQDFAFNGLVGCWLFANLDDLISGNYSNRFRIISNTKDTITVESGSNLTSVTSIGKNYIISLKEIEYNNSSAPTKQEYMIDYSTGKVKYNTWQQDMIYYGETHPRINSLVIDYKYKQQLQLRSFIGTLVSGEFAVIYSNADGNGGKIKFGDETTGHVVTYKYKESYILTDIVYPSLNDALQSLKRYQFQLSATQNEGKAAPIAGTDSLIVSYEYDRYPTTTFDSQVPKPLVTPTYLKIKTSGATAGTGTIIIRGTKAFQTKQTIIADLGTNIERDESEDNLIITVTPPTGASAASSTSFIGSVCKVYNVTKDYYYNISSYYLYNDRYEFKAIREGYADFDIFTGYSEDLDPDQFEILDLEGANSAYYPAEDDIIEVTFIWADMWVDESDSEILEFTEFGTQYSKYRYWEVRGEDESPTSFTYSGFTNEGSVIRPKIQILSINQPGEYDNEGQIIDDYTYKVSYNYEAPVANEDITINYVYNATIGEAQVAVENARSVTSDILVKAALPVEIDITATVQLLENYNATTTQQELERSIGSWLVDYKLGRSIQVSDLITIIGSTDGVDSVVVSKMACSGSTGTADINLTSREYFTLGTLLLTVSEVS